MLRNIESLLPRTAAALAQGSGEVHIGAQFYAWHAGREYQYAVGEARVGAPMRDDSVMLWLSAGKPLTAVAIAMLAERGQVQVDAPVATYIPEFAAEGKEGVTVRQLLTHTAGLRGPERYLPIDSWEQIIASICAMRLEPRWVPGQKGGYHVSTTWYLLGEIIRRIAGQGFDLFIREQILDPLGMRETRFTIAPEEQQALGDRLGVLYMTQPPPLRPAPQEVNLAHPNPAAGARGPIRELGRFYRMMLSGGQIDGVRLLQPQTVEAMVSRHRLGLMDHTFRHIMDWGLGFIINSRKYIDHPYGFGPYASDRTFGHGGAQSSGGFADPQNDLAVAYLYNGMPGEHPHRARIAALLPAVYEDLAIAGNGT